MISISIKYRFYNERKLHTVNCKAIVIYIIDSIIIVSIKIQIYFQKMFKTFIYDLEPK